MKHPKKMQKLLILMVFSLLKVQIIYADIPNIKITLLFSDKKETVPYYDSDENIKIKVTVINESSKDIVTSDGFTSKKFHRSIKLTGPSGNLLLPGYVGKPLSEKIDSHVPPLGYVMNRNTRKLVRAAPCEIFKKDTKIISTSDRIKDIFNISLPGYYSAQAQDSLIIFNNEICDIDNYIWQGLLKSDTRYFFYKGGSKVGIDPLVWKISWKDRPVAKPVKVEMFLNNKIKAENIDYKSIRLNYAVKPVKFGRGETEPGSGEKSLLLYFNPEDCIKSLHYPREEQRYPVIISGKFKKGIKFGGAQRITIVQ